MSQVNHPGNISGKRYLAYQHEAAYLLMKGRPQLPSWAIPDVIQWTDYPKNELHPSQKPLSILTPLIEAFCPPGGTVLDPFAGSGSTLVAARQLGRRYLGIELDAEYYGIAARRLDELVFDQSRSSQNLFLNSSQDAQCIEI